MNHLNTVLIEGNLTRDPQYGSAKDGCSFTIANNRYYLKDGKWVNEASFFIVFAYGRLGDSCLKYLTKGRGVRVCGRLKQFTSNRRNLPQDFVFIVAEHVEFQPARNTEKAEASNANLENITEQNDNTQLKANSHIEDLDAKPVEPSVSIDADPEDEAKANANSMMEETEVAASFENDRPTANEETINPEAEDNLTEKIFSS